MNRLIARMDAPNEVRALPLALRRALRQLHQKYYQLTFSKANRFSLAVPGLSDGDEFSDAYAVVFSPRFNHIGIYFDTSGISPSDVLAINMYLVELLALLERYGYKVNKANPLRRIYTADGAENTVRYILLSFGSSGLFYHFEL